VRAPGARTVIWPAAETSISTPPEGTIVMVRRRERCDGLGAEGESGAQLGTLHGCGERRRRNHDHDQTEHDSAGQPSGSRGEEHGREDA